ncbi:MAG: rod shape-determining protein MreC [Cyclobacteriaceae bacterium]
MLRLFDLLYRYRVFIFFLFLEVVCFWLIGTYNRYYNSQFFNSSNYIAGSVQKLSANTSDYFSLDEVNRRLVEENKMLREQLSQASLQKFSLDTLDNVLVYQPARVINNDFRRSENFITLDAGSLQDIEPGMGVIADQGAVGVVKSVSKNFATVTTLLHQNLMVSSVLKSSKTLCTTQWDALNPLESELKYIPRHIELNIGDTVVTSGFNSVFPENVLIGTIASFELPKESPYYSAKVRLSNDFTSIDYVYVVQSELKLEKDSLEVAYE